MGQNVASLIFYILGKYILGLFLSPDFVEFKSCIQNFKIFIIKENVWHYREWGWDYIVVETTPLKKLIN